MNTIDTRVVMGANCMWWGDIGDVGETELRKGVSIPCCPFCGGVLYEMPTPEDWWKQVDTYEADGHPGYHKFVEWLKGKCFTSRAKAVETYEEQTGIKVTIS